jgi:large subunit ribosomal protein L25
MADLQLAAQPRSVTGRKVRQLRNEGLIPAVIYGKTTAPQALQVVERSVERVLSGGGNTRLIELAVEGSKKHNALIRSVERHPVTHRLTHIDFYAVNMAEKQQVNIPLQSSGHPEALVGGLMLLQVVDQVLVEALPADLPAEIVVDITSLTLEQPITVADLPKIPGVEYITEPDTPLFTLSVTRAEVESEAPAETDAEPEVVSSRQEDEETEGEE